MAISNKKLKGIEPKPKNNDFEFRIKRVAAYCRVSTDMDAQKTSIENQMETFKQTIAEHGGWELAGIYADKGLTGTSVLKREEFLRMIEDSRKGLIDVILVKSISRFARNTLDLLRYTRELKELGVEVYFEKEKIGTFSSTSEMLLSVYAAFAQEESRSISENGKTARRKRAEMGRGQWTNVYGYYKDAKNSRQILEEEAENVRWIYDMAIQGMSLKEIAAELNALDIPSPGNAKAGWMSTTVSVIIRNEKYVGDMLTNKVFVEDFLTKKVVKNKNGEKMKQTLIKDHHEPIVDRETFWLANYIQTLKNQKIICSQYPYYGFLKCPYCGKPMVKYSWNNRAHNCWVCGGDGERGLQKERSSCSLFIMPMSYVDKLMTEAIKELNPAVVPQAKEMQELLDKRNQIEYVMLYHLVESISFPDRFTMQIVWKNGTVTDKPITYDRVSDIPDPVVVVKKCWFEVCGVETGQLGYSSVLNAIAERKEIASNIYIEPVKDSSPRVYKPKREVAQNDKKS